MAVYYGQGGKKPAELLAGINGHMWIVIWMEHQRASEEECTSSQVFPVGLYPTHCKVTPRAGYEQESRETPGTHLKVKHGPKNGVCQSQVLNQAWL